MNHSIKMILKLPLAFALVVLFAQCNPPSSDQRPGLKSSLPLPLSRPQIPSQLSPHVPPGQCEGKTEAFCLPGVILNPPGVRDAPSAVGILSYSFRRNRLFFAAQFVLDLLELDPRRPEDLAKIKKLPYNLEIMGLASHIDALIRTPSTFDAQLNDDSITIGTSALRVNRQVLIDAMSRISLMEQLEDPQLRGKAPIAPELEGAPDWVRWTCFDALRVRQAQVGGEGRRYPFCAVAASPAEKGETDERLFRIVHFSMDIGEMRKAEGLKKHSTGPQEEAELDERLRGEPLFRERWVSPGGEVWELSAIAEEDLLHAIGLTESFGPSAVRWVKGRLDQEYRSFE
ncbi:MAG: hypothetical protein LBM75_05270 [Myxococcales bacterium]|nr:hypothetical protein [Myxococcales bacterium]